MTSFKERLASYWGISHDDLAGLEGPAFSLSSDFIMGDGKEVNKAISLIQETIKTKGKVLVYGDYDCDGVMSTSILLRALKELGAEAYGYLPSREKDGYGFNLVNAEKIVKAQYSLLILVDNGISAFAAISYAKKYGLRVIVIDHHALQNTLPEADVILHPELQNYGEYPVSAGFYSYIFSVHLLGREDDYLRDLGALSLLSDMMPLRGRNHAYAKLLLDDFSKNKIPEFSLLLQEEGRSELELSKIIAKINAIGRMDEGGMSALLTYFASREKEEKCAAYFEAQNEKRKNLTKLAALQIEVTSSPAVVALINAKIGLTSLIANRVLEERGKPCAIFAPKDDFYVGSIRSGDAFNAVEFLANLPFALLSYGGHYGAAGCSLKKEDLPLFQKEFTFIAAKAALEKKEEEKPFLSLEKEEINENTMNYLRLLAPFGEGLENPLLRFGAYPSDTFRFLKEGKYLMLPLSTSLKILSFQLGEKDFLPHKSYSFYAKLQEGRFQEKKQLTLLVNKAILRE